MPETYNQLNAYFAIVPGNYAFNLRKLYLRYYAFAKRMMDLIGSLLLLVLLAPLFFLIAVAVRLDSPAPAIFVQERVGRNGVLFKMYKFRSMHVRVPNS